MVTPRRNTHLYGVVRPLLYSSSSSRWSGVTQDVGEERERVGSERMCVRCVSVYV